MRDFFKTIFAYVLVIYVINGIILNAAGRAFLYDTPEGKTRLEAFGEYFTEAYTKFIDGTKKK